MGRYIEWDDVVNRYPEIDTLGGSDEISSTYIVYAEAMVDGLLNSHFTPPFSNNNMTVKDLSIDCVFWRAARFKDDNATEVRSAFFETIMMLKDGKLDMVDESGNTISADANPGIYSTTQSYHTSFGMDDPKYWRVDSGHMADVADSRL